MTIILFIGLVSADPAPPFPIADAGADYELGKLEARNGDKEEARRHIELVLSGKVLEVNWSGRKGA